MHSPRWTWLTLIACATAAAQGTPARRAQPLLTQRGSRPAAAEEFTEPAEDGENPGRTWAIPIGWTRSLAYDLRATHAAGEGRTLAQLVAGNLGLRTFVYAPGSPRQRQHRPDEHLDQPGPRLLLPRRSRWVTDASLHEQIRARAVHHRQRAGGRLPKAASLRGARGAQRQPHRQRPGIHLRLPDAEHRFRSATVPTAAGGT